MAQALYNVLRPQRFSEVIGQTAAAVAVKNGLKKGELEHSLIFYGQTGGGKTTMARIVGSFLNCKTPTEEGEPCCECDNCLALRAGNFQDYEELNAATHGGKDDIDALIANVSYLPQVGRAKVFVIDEAHCLTTSAWKSLLKVLEEPPSHVYFILCTTNFQAIPPEIQNRCGKYEFSAIGEAEVLAYLQGIEGSSQFSEEALSLVAKHARGSMRDAVNSFSHIKLPYPSDYVIQVGDVEKYLNIITPDTLATLLRACCEMDMGTAFRVISEAESSAMDITKLVQAILSQSSAMVTLLAGGRLPVGASEVDVKGIELNRLVTISNKLNEVYSNTSTRNYAALRLAIASVCCVVGSGTCATADNSLIQALLGRISKLENGMVSPTEDTIGRVGVLPSERENREVKWQIEPMAEAVAEQEQENEDSLDNFFAMFGVSDDAQAEEEDEEGVQGSVEPMQDTTDVVDDKPMDDMDYYMAAYSDYASDVDSDAIPHDEPIIEPVVNPVQKRAVEDIDDDNPFTANGSGLVVGGIVFSDSSLAAEFRESSTKGAKADTALMAACKGDDTFEVLVNEMCKKKVTESGVTLATPFNSTKGLLDKYLTCRGITDVSVVVVDGLKI